MFETERLLISKAKRQDCELLTAIQNSWDDQESMTGENGATVEYFITGLTEGHIPPSGRKENYHLLAIRFKTSNEIIGVLEIYEGYPNEKTLWLGQLVINKNSRCQGFGQEVVAGMKNWSMKNGFDTMKIGVYLKNILALKFWSKNGFDKIISISGDLEYGKDKITVITLESKL